VKWLKLLEGDRLIHAYRMTTDDLGGATKRELILKDSVTFLVLTLITVALFGVTLLLFRSFDGHREELAKRWGERGRAQLQAGQAAAAVVSLRAGLAYAPDDYTSQLLLAQALADSGEIDQATNYFLNLWDARPGDGFLNLQLARLERRKGNAAEAKKYYRASIFGDWRGDGSIRRRDVRLELVDYLMQQHELDSARVELLTAAGNAPNSLHLEGMFATKLLAAGDPNDALALYEKAIADNPHDAGALAGAGRIEFAQGDYAKARLLLARALLDTPAKAEGREELAASARDAARLTELSLARELPAEVRGAHLLTGAKIAQARLTDCLGRGGAGAELGVAVEDLQGRWRAVNTSAKLRAMAANAEGQDALAELIFDTERTTQTMCGAPSGDDALLLKLANGPEGRE